MTSTCLDAITEVSALTCKPCGKLNLTLRIFGRRPDQYHDLHSLVVGVDVRDELTLRPRAQLGIAIHCADPALAVKDNLAVRACAALADHVGISPALDLDLIKRIPIAGGMGGGSSDAAAALRMANRLWGLDLDDSELVAVGEAIGSDVPLFFSLPVAEMTGRGERVRPRKMIWSGWALLVHVETPVHSAAVYAAYDAGAVSLEPHLSDYAVETILASREVTEFEHLLFNDLEPAVLRVAPAVREIYRTLELPQYGPFRISGAGSTLFRLFDTSEAAQEMAHRIAELDLGVRCIVAAVPTGHELID